MANKGSSLLKARWLGRKKTDDELKSQERFTKDCLLFLARHSILALFENLTLEEYIKEKYPSDKRFDKIKEGWGDLKYGVRVSLIQNGNLRGSKGSFESKNNVYDDIVEFSRISAFEDERFPRITKKDFKTLKYEIFIMDGDRIPLAYNDPMELLVLLGKSKDMGVMVEKDKKSSYFLPDTWDLIPEPGMFLSSLCMSATLPASSWRGQKRIWPGKRTELRRDLYTGKIVKPDDWGKLNVYHLPVTRINGVGKTLKDV